MLEWSKYFQNPYFMELTRKYLIPKELVPVVLEYCGISDHMTVLDVGCGTGYFSRLIAENSPMTRVTGLEYEQRFVEYAKKISKDKSLDISFMQGDALELPFESESFDAVTSHTFLTSISDPVKSLKEMVRVCKEGGVISSITAMSFAPAAIHRGIYPKECTWAEPLSRLNEKMWNMFETINPIQNYVNKLPLAEIPHLFVMCGLQDICAYPIGKMFSLSNASLSYEERMDYLEQLIKAERQKLEVYMEMKEARKLFSKEEAQEYLRLMEEKKEYYKNNPNENAIWEWDGGANILISGKRGKYSEQQRV